MSTWLVSLRPTRVRKQVSSIHPSLWPSSLEPQIAFLGREDSRGFTIWCHHGIEAPLAQCQEVSHQLKPSSTLVRSLIHSTYNLKTGWTWSWGSGGKPVLAQCGYARRRLATQEPTNIGIHMNPPYSAKWSLQAPASFKILASPHLASLAPQSKRTSPFSHPVITTSETSGQRGSWPSFLTVSFSVAMLKNHSQGLAGRRAVIRWSVFLPISSSIPAFQRLIIILKKNRTNRDVYFIDASKRNLTRAESRTWRMPISRRSWKLTSHVGIDKIAHLAGEEIVENVTVSITYVDTFEEGRSGATDEVVAKINQTNATIEADTSSLLDMLSQLLVRNDTRSRCRTQEICPRV